GVLLILSGMRLIGGQRSTAPADAPQVRLSTARTVGSGGLIGLLSSLLGVGGGTVAIPILLYLVKLDVKKVAATSMGIIGLTATAGTLGYVFSGMGEPGRPPWSLGYIHLSAGLVMFLASVVSVRWGALLNQRLRPRTLELMFGIVFVVLGLRLVGGNLIALALGS